MRALHCDRWGCTTWQREDEATDWITLQTPKTILGHFCTLDHATHWAAAHSGPSEIRDLDL